jgi:hypothetical protein
MVHIHSVDQVIVSGLSGEKPRLSLVFKPAHIPSGPEMQG